MIRRPPRSTQSRSSAASDVYKRQAVHGDAVYQGRARIGVITSAARSPLLDKNLALCRIDKSHADTGTSVEVGKLDGHQKRIKAQVVQTPVYDPERRRLRA